MTTRLDLAIEKYPAHEEGLRLLASRDPSNGKLKYLEWSAKMLASGQALAPEISDVVELFHQFAGRSLEVAGRRRRAPESQRVHPDIHTYRPQDLARLRDLLLKIKRQSDSKRRKREKLYKIEGAVEADVIYDSDDLIVRHIKNKQASVHYGLGTKWCIAMLREGYFEDYEAQNATFFFFERKAEARRKDEYDKVALMLPRCGGDGNRRDERATAFTALDRGVDMMALADHFGTRVFDLFRLAYEASEKYPGSALSCVYRGEATPEQLEAVFAATTSKAFKYNPYMEYTLEDTLVAICCNDAAPLDLLTRVGLRTEKLCAADQRRRKRRRRRFRVAYRRAPMGVNVLVAAALAIHPNVPVDLRAKALAALRKRRVATTHIRRTMGYGPIGITFDPPIRRYRHRRRVRHFHPVTPRRLRERANQFKLAAARCRKRAAKMEAAAAKAKKTKKRRAS